MKKIVRKAVIFGLIGVVIILFAKNTFFKKEEEVILENTEIFNVKAQEIKKEMVSATFTINGQTNAKLRVPLKSRTSGKLQKIFKEKGDVVKKGEPIFELSIDDRQSKINAAKAKVKDAEFRYQTTKELVDQKFESPLSLAKEKAALESVVSELQSLEQELDFTTITAPFDGIFDTKFVDVGNVITPQTELGIYVSLNPLTVSSNLPEKYFGSIDKNTKVDVEFLNGEIATGEVGYVSNIMEEKTRTFNIETDIRNDDFKIGIGQTAKLKFHLAKEEGYFLSNQSMLSLSDDGTIGVKIVNSNNEVEFIAIEIIKNKDEGLLVRGLTDGMKVITFGGDFTEIGQKVNIKE